MSSINPVQRERDPLGIRRAITKTTQSIRKTLSYLPGTLALDILYRWGYQGRFFDDMNLFYSITQGRVDRVFLQAVPEIEPFASATTSIEYLARKIRDQGLNTLNMAFLDPSSRPYEATKRAIEHLIGTGGIHIFKSNFPDQVEMACNINPFRGCSLTAMIAPVIQSSISHLDTALTIAKAFPVTTGVTALVVGGLAYELLSKAPQEEVLPKQVESEAPRPKKTVQGIRKKSKLGIRRTNPKIEPANPRTRVLSEFKIKTRRRGQV